MAAIIARISRANIERKRNKKLVINIDKSNVELPAFGTHFDPHVHNKYLRCKRLAQERKKDEKRAFLQELFSQEDSLLNDGKETLERNLIRNEAERNGFKVRMNNPTWSDWCVTGLIASLFIAAFAIMGCVIYAMMAY